MENTSVSNSCNCFLSLQLDGFEVSYGFQENGIYIIFFSDHYILTIADLVLSSEIHSLLFRRVGTSETIILYMEYLTIELANLKFFNEIL